MGSSWWECSCARPLYRWMCSALPFPQPPCTQYGGFPRCFNPAAPVVLYIYIHVSDSSSSGLSTGQASAENSLHSIYNQQQRDQDHSTIYLLLINPNLQLHTVWDHTHTLPDSNLSIYGVPPVHKHLKVWLSQIHLTVVMLHYFC